ncbi:hypothetical protein A2400_01335 [candidate division WS6 bacterium RIFOXYB1_FULL_33_14]|uniref:Uncharacterized protein n=1 Tax=candidate division WS6 bacterium RIFOXYB1_FULL_33_14 TaxID=1817896 RepID=A0A1F4UH37_9BACT|nr:MAG: hypothetical protein A2400_01335 [candidate division WS6 bacterium RIFOXYB1_FULL_33_14]
MFIKKLKVPSAFPKYGIFPSILSCIACNIAPSPPDTRYISGFFSSNISGNLFLISLKNFSVLLSLLYIYLIFIPPIIPKLKLFKSDILKSIICFLRHP